MRTVPLGDVASIQYGWTAKASPEASGPKFLRITDIQNGRVDWTSVPRCEIPSDKIDNYLLQPGDIVFARIGATTGKSYRIDTQVPDDAVFASYLIRVRPRSDVLRSDFLAWFFQSADYWAYILRASRGIGRPAVNGSLLGQLDVPLLPLNYQEAAVERLDALSAQLDDGASHLLRAETDVPVFMRSVMRQAFVGKQNLVELQELAALSSGGTPARRDSSYYGGDIPWVKIGDLTEGAVETTEETLTELGLQASSANLLPAGTVLLAMYGASIGRTGVLGIPATTNQAICAIQPDPALVDTRYLLYYLQYSKATFVAAGYGGAQPNISQRYLRTFRVPLLSLEEQASAVEFIRGHKQVAESLSGVLRRSSADVEKLRSSLLRQVLAEGRADGEDISLAEGVV